MMTKRERIQRNILVFGSAGIERIGEESPASTIATDTFVLKEIAQLVKHEEEEEGEIKSIMCVCVWWNVMKDGNHIQELKYFQFQRMSGNLHLI